jgi:hypothetical protein
LICFLFVAVSLRVDEELGLDLCPCLLYYMRQLVSHQLPTAGTTRAIGPLPEKDVPAGGEGAGVQCAVERVGLDIGMYLHIAKVSAKGWLHLGPYPAVQCLPATACSLDGLLHLRGHFGAVSLSGQGQCPLHEAVPELALQPKQWVFSSLLPSFCQLSRQSGVRFSP